MYKRASPDGGAITCIWLVARGRRSGRGCPAARLIRCHGAIAGVSERLGLGGDRIAFRIVATCIWHPRENVTVYFEAKHGLLYLPVERCSAHDDNEEINVEPARF